MVLQTRTAEIFRYLCVCCFYFTPLYCEVWTNYFSPFHSCKMHFESFFFPSCCFVSFLFSSCTNQYVCPIVHVCMCERIRIFFVSICTFDDEKLLPQQVIAHAFILFMVQCNCICMQYVVATNNPLLVLSTLFLFFSFFFIIFCRVPVLLLV